MTYNLPIIAIIFLSLTTGSIAEETVINKNGDSILLKNDGTWEKLTLPKGKVVFSIYKADEYFKSYIEKTEFGEFSHYRNYYGCKYLIMAKNNTPYKVKIKKFELESNAKMFSRSKSAFLQWRKLILPNDSFVGNGDYNIARISTDVSNTTHLPNEAQIQSWKIKYGCQAQSGSLSIASPGYPTTDIEFDKNPEITDLTKNNFIIGSGDGVYPIHQKINLQ
jgi:hypothetical protein